MDRSKILAAALVVAALTVPSAVATWYGRGDYEPNTRWDATEGRMFTEPDWTPAQATLAGERVYFNGFIENAIIGANPNVGKQLGGVAGNTRIAAAWSAIPTAMLGLWKDCNKDGYIGMAESAILDYKSELLLVPDANGVAPGTSVCPVTPRNPATEAPVHNDGTWVKEYIAIGMVDPCEFKPDPYRDAHCGGEGQFTKNWDVLYVNNTLVWDDDTRPGVASGGGTCPLGVLPRGATASTGGVINYYDCFIGRRTANTVNTLDPDGSRDLRFDDPQNPQTSDSLLNQEFPVHPWGNPYTGSSGALQSYDQTDSRYTYDPAFEVSDCSASRTDVRDPTAGPTGNGTLNQVGVKAPAGTPEAVQTEQDYLLVSGNFTDNNGVIVGAYGYQPNTDVSPQGSWWAGFEDAYDAFYLGSDYQSNEAGDCDRATNNTYHGFWEDALEGDNDATPAVKNVNSDTMTFYDGFRGVIDDETDGQLGIKYTPIDLGVNLVRSFYGGPTWSGAGTVGYFQYVNRNTLEPHPARFRTYYAYIDPVEVSRLGLVLPTVSTGKYGADACTAGIGAGQPPQNGWQCDPAKWWKDASGGDSMPYYSDELNKIPQGRKVGEDFTFRDVDCYDGHVGGVASEGVFVYASGVQYNPNDPRVCTQF